MSTASANNGVTRSIGGWLKDWPVLRQLAGANALGDAAVSPWSRGLTPRTAQAERVGRSICPYCAVGCGQLIYAKGNDILQIEGDPESPINEGTLCPKGAATLDWLHSPLRLKTVKYRAPYSDQWEERPLEWAMDRIAQRVRQTRDETFVTTLPGDRAVNHTLAIASLGGATLDNEENYLIKKLFAGGLGMVWIENQARVCHSSSVPSMGGTFGWGVATMPQWEVANADCVVIMGSNMAENHPIAFRFVMQAKEKGATVIHADPRFTRTSAMADIYAPVRSGSDIAFLGGLIHYILENDLWFRDYCLNYTNLSTIIEDDYEGPEDLDGHFSGWDPDTKSHKIASWQYRGMGYHATMAEHYAQTGESEVHDRTEHLKQKPPPRDPTLQHPRCVYQILKRHYSRYTPEMVERISGCPQKTFLRIAEQITRNSGRDRTTAWCYAVGWNHHTTGVQIIRAAAIVQSLLGNVGRPGGGILVLRGHASIQGSTDVPSLYNLLPGYMAHPNVNSPHNSLKEYLEYEGSPTGWWSEQPKYMVSLLRAWYGDAAGPDNEWGFHWIPKIVGNHSQLPMTMAIADGTIRGLFLMGQNPAVGGHNARLVTKGLASLEWMVARDAFENETASFWLDSPEVKTGELNPADIKTEIFLLPAALPGEKEGTFTNTHRMVQWHDKVVEPPGDCRSEHWFLYHLGRRLKALYADSTEPQDKPLQQLTWDYRTSGEHDEPQAEDILREMNGYTWPQRRQLADPEELKDDGTTACGVWIYCGAYPRDDHNQTRSRQPDGPDGPGSHLEWAFSWPGNRRMLYSRASADPQGNPWSERKRYVWWDAERQEWVGKDTPDVVLHKPPSYEPDWESQPHGLEALDGRSPFLMTADGKAAIFVPSGLKDGPLPTHYEPVESPVKNALYTQQDNPAAKKFQRLDNPYHDVADGRYPHVLTTFRLVEHHTGGMMSRGTPTLSELQPEGFCEIPPELADDLGIGNLDWIVLTTARGEVRTRALVTQRLRPFHIDGRRIYQIGMPWHFGWKGLATGEVANRLTPITMDPNCMIHEGKVLTCNVRRSDRA
jgi:formate dehydrogenase major subunit